MKNLKNASAIVGVALVLSCTSSLLAAPPGGMHVEVARSHPPVAFVLLSLDSMVSAANSVIVTTAEEHGFIHPGAPQVHPTDSVMLHPSFDNLIPTTLPVTVVTPPTVPASSDNLVHPTDQPVIPKCTP